MGLVKFCPIGIYYLAAEGDSWYRLHHVEGKASDQAGQKTTWFHQQSGGNVIKLIFFVTDEEA
jgi:hypothetical protein